METKDIKCPREKRIEELESSNARLRDALEEAENQLYDLPELESKILSLLGETPAQSLSHIEARAIESVAETLSSSVVIAGNDFDVCFTDDLVQFAKELEDGKQ